jgi:hypothetical protein
MRLEERSWSAEGLSFLSQGLAFNRWSEGQISWMILPLY